MNFSFANVIDIQDKIEISFGISLEILSRTFFLSLDYLLGLIQLCMLKVETRESGTT